jgi:Ca2+-transporting ATPase
MLAGIALGGAALWGAVFIPYWSALYLGVSSGAAQTAAFSSWMIGHILLAFFSRSAHDPLYRTGVFSNRVMVLWATGAIVFLALLLTVHAIGQRFGITPISAGTVLVIAGFALACMAGFEVAKFFKKNEKMMAG